MKTVSVLFADENSLHVNDAVFNGVSSYDRALCWAHAVTGSTGIFVFAGRKNAGLCREAAQKADIPVTVVEKARWTARELFTELATVSEQTGADAAVYAYGDCPFLDKTLTDELIAAHMKYYAEYTFADGYPYGFAPEVLDKGAASILAGLCTGIQQQEGAKRVARDTIFSVLKTDINSFEIETILAPEDWRLFRLEFSCGTKAGVMACSALYKAGTDGRSAAELAQKAVKNPGILRTVPGFYNVAIAEPCSGTCTYCPYPAAYKEGHSGKTPASGKFMPYEKFELLVKQMAALSENAVVSLSAWGEPLMHPDFIKFVQAVLAERGLSVLVETDGFFVTEELCRQLKAVADAVQERKNGQDCIIWIVSLDAVTEQTYAALRGSAGTLAQSSEAVALLSRYFPGNVYPQMVRMEKNEDELERFYRFWKEQTAPAGGSFIIQKYDNFCGLLPDSKPADLSPIGRDPCWHLRRDMTILADGSVPPCHEYILNGCTGNVFNEQLADVWNKLSLSETEKCRKCDEYYTYNF
jgi:spiro-SPASM protein